MDRGSKPVPAWANSNPLFKYGYKTVRMLKNEGLAQTVFAAKYVTRRYFKLKSIKKAFYLTPEQRAQQQAAVFPCMPLVSVVVPLYNTDEGYLRDLIGSVRAQSYRNWELCLADGSDAAHGSVGDIARESAAADARIRYKKLEKNEGIAGNRNAAVRMSSGAYVGLLDHDDLLAQSALYDVVEAINATGADFLYSDEATFVNKPSDSRSMHFKPCFSPDFLRGCNYICHFSVIRRSLLDETGLYDPAFDGSEDYDFTLRVTEKAKKIHHIAKPLYYWRIHAGSVAADISAKPYAYDAARRSVQAHLDRTGLRGTVVYSKAVPMMRVIYDIIGEPLVSIIIPSCDHADMLGKCIGSVLGKSTYKNLEIIVLENGSKEDATFAYYKSLAGNPRVRVVAYDKQNVPFNFSALNNYARQFAKGEQLLFLNNDIEVITPGWIEEMLMFTQRADVGACGIKLLYPNDTVQHGGIAMGVCGSAANLCPLFPRDHEGYMSRLAIASNMSACTAACLMVKAAAFDAVGGFDEQLAVSFNDVDLCLKLREKGYLIVFNPVAEAYHYESRTRGYDKNGEKKARMEREKALLRKKWPSYYEEDPGDPYYNRNFGKNSVSYDA
ncbi:MAG: glycosyltransferase family 2 protein [Oscillospiraceae bacterium]|nr:glycosyltransferase family 2 protein [Oscillospiraceae bacterium]